MLHRTSNKIAIYSVQIRCFPVTILRFCTRMMYNDNATELISYLVCFIGK